MSELNAARPGPVTPRRRWWRFGLPLLVLLIALVLAVVLVQTAPKATRDPVPSQARLVEVRPVTVSDVVTEIEAMGTVIPALEVVLHPQVSGEVLSISDELVPGGRFRKGDELLRIDPADYELAVRQRDSERAQAQSNVSIERGQQVIARREFELLGEPTGGDDSALMLRRPQLAAVQASLAMAEAALERARLDLSRTRIRAPFNAIVQSREVNTGARVTPVSTLATLVGTDRYWLELAVPVDQLRWLQIPGVTGSTGSAVRIYNETAWGAERFRRGRVIRLAGDLEPESRMARVLVAVDDPLALQTDAGAVPVLLLNSYARAIIEGQTLSGVVRLDRSLLRDQDRVWVLGEDGRLQIRRVTVAFRGLDSVLVSAGLSAGDQVVVTDLTVPVDGMPLRRATSPSPPTAPAVSPPVPAHE